MSKIKNGISSSAEGGSEKEISALMLIWTHKSKKQTNKNKNTQIRKNHHIVRYENQLILKLEKKKR